MIRLRSLLATALVLTLGAAPALAQPGMRAPADSVPGPRMGMMRSGMMGPGMRAMHPQMMMQNPMHRSHMTALMLPALADTLGLSEQQVSQLKSLKSEVVAQRQEHRETMTSRCDQFTSLFEGEDFPAADAVREHLTTMATLRAEHRATTYELAQEMREVLTSEQREALSEMTPQERMRQVMSHMPMMDMMQMMRAPRRGMMGGCSMGRMQGRPMMQGMQEGPRMRPNRENR